MASFGQRLRELRNEKDVTQEEVLTYLVKCGINVSKGTYSKWENNKHEPGFSAIDKLCEYFKVSADYLLGRTENK